MRVGTFKKIIGRRQTNLKGKRGEEVESLKVERYGRANIDFDSVSEQRRLNEGSSVEFFPNAHALYSYIFIRVSNRINCKLLDTIRYITIPNYCIIIRKLLDSTLQAEITRYISSSQNRHDIFPTYICSWKGILTNRAGFRRRDVFYLFLLGLPPISILSERRWPGSRPLSLWRDRSQMRDRSTGRIDRRRMIARPPLPAARGSSFSRGKTQPIEGSARFLRSTRDFLHLRSFIAR